MRLVAFSILVLAATVAVSAFFIVRSEHHPHTSIVPQRACYGCGGSVYGQRP